MEEKKKERQLALQCQYDLHREVNVTLSFTPT